MNNTPLVTVGIPAFNAERFISLAIKSVLAQTYSNFELIITDDGSTDKTIEIARSFNDPRIKVFSDGQNQGISYRLNQQIDLAKGKYFVRMDSDDIMLPDRIEKQIQYLEDNLNIDAIGGAAIIIDDDNAIIGIRRESKEVALTPDNWFSGLSFIHPTVTARIDFFRKYKYSDNLKGVEDQDLWFRSSLDSKMVILTDYVLCYREPLYIKLSTYLFRRKQNRSFWKSKMLTEYFGAGKCLKIICKSYLKSIIAIISHFIGLESKQIARRNQKLSQNAETYKFVIDYINNL